MADQKRAGCMLSALRQCACIGRAAGPNCRFWSADLDGDIKRSGEQTAGWRPIATRPMDGTRYLAVTAHGYIRLVRQDDPDDRLPIGDSPGGVWPDLPTHWMPLPEFPGVAA